jgi:hypothetical protein
MRIEAAATVAERLPVEVVETDGNGFPEEGASGIGDSGLEACGSIHLDALFVLEERGPGIEMDATPERPERDGGSSVMAVRCGVAGDSGWRRCDDAVEDAHGGGFGASFEGADEVHDIAAAAGCETVPQAAPKMDPEGGGVVAAVERAWPHQLVAVLFKTTAKVVEFKHPADADLLFEVFKERLAHTVSAPAK